MFSTRKIIAALFLTASILTGAPRADADVTITVINNLPHTMSLAFCWAGFDDPDDGKRGWFNVETGQTRVITLGEVSYRLSSESFGYYAQGGQTAWGGNLRQVVIDPKKAFRGHPDDPIEGGITVGFRKVNLKDGDEDGDNGIATLTFNPK